jgi:hypothetical protein
VHDFPKKWKLWIPMAEFWYNTSFHSSLGCTPFKVSYGYDHVLDVAPMLPVTDNKYVEEVFTDR